VSCNALTLNRAGGGFYSCSACSHFSGAFCCGGESDHVYWLRSFGLSDALSIAPAGRLSFFYIHVRPRRLPASSFEKCGQGLQGPYLHIICHSNAGFLFFLFPPIQFFSSIK
jgi:hypothetical protein